MACARLGIRKPQTLSRLKACILACLAPETRDLCLSLADVVSFAGFGFVKGRKQGS